MPVLNVQLVTLALLFLGGEAELRDIYQALLKLAPQLLDDYKDDATYRATIRGTIERHCPQSENWRTKNDVHFEKVGRGRYRLVASDERESVIAKGRRL